MNYPDLLSHFMNNHCYEDHLDDGRVIITQYMNGHCVELEVLNSYDDIAVAYFCDTLHIPVPRGYERALKAIEYIIADVNKK